jgi:hypothetical protein
VKYGRAKRGEKINCELETEDEVLNLMARKVKNNERWKK